MSATAIKDRYGNRWQYHSRSDHHSKVACWGILFDLLQVSPLLQQHVRTRKIVFGINHKIVDFQQNREKVLDMVLCRPLHEGAPGSSPVFKGLAARYGIALTASEQRVLDALPDIDQAPTGSVCVALEAKACMTEHVKAAPRLYDELNSSHSIVHGGTTTAIAAGQVLINAATAFWSPGRQTRKVTSKTAVVNKHKQPDATLRSIAAVQKLPRRSGPTGVGFDALSISVIECPNDGSPVTLVTQPPAAAPGSAFDYDSMILRMAQEYVARFSAL